MEKTVLITERLEGRGTLLLEHFRDKKLIAVRAAEFPFGNFRRGAPNLVTDAGKAVFADLFIGGVVTPQYIALGTGTTAAAAGDTALETETDGYRKAADRTRTTITVTNDTSQYTYTFAILDTYSFTEAGLLSADSGGTLFCRQVYTALPVLADDSLKATWRLQH